MPAIDQGLQIGVALVPASVARNGQSQMLGHKHRAWRREGAGVRASGSEKVGFVGPAMVRSALVLPLQPPTMASAAAL